MIILPVVCMGMKLGLLTLREEQADGAGEQGVEENIWTQEE
jgi:hypothetical protein